MANNYEIFLSDGSTIIVPENKIDKDKTSIALIGHGQPAYGKEQNENFLHILENFSSKDEPKNPIKGQIWFKQNDDNITYELRICKVGATDESPAVWDKVMKTSVSDEGEPLNPSNGDIWYDTSSKQLKVYDEDNSSWIIIGPSDVTHNQTDYYSGISQQGSTKTTYKIDASIFERDVEDDMDPTSTYTGSLSLVTLNVLLKEVVKDGVSYDVDNLRSAVFIYRFVVRCLSSESIGKEVSIEGSPNYEIISKSDNLDFEMDLTVKNGSVEFAVNNLSTINKTYFVTGIDASISRI